MQQIDLHTDPRLRRQAKQLYLEAFPKEERLPWWVLWLNSLRRGIDLTAFVEDGAMIGFTASVTTARMHFLLFFAVPETSRGCGHGSAILTQLRQQHQAVTLNVELLDPEAENYPQRQRRFRFYGRNGFFDTGYHVWEVGGKFRVLATQPELDVASYREIFRKLSFGVWNVKLKKDEG